MLAGKEMQCFTYSFQCCWFVLYHWQLRGCIGDFEGKIFLSLFVRVPLCFCAGKVALLNFFLTMARFLFAPLFRWIKLFLRFVSVSAIFLFLYLACLFTLLYGCSGNTLLYLFIDRKKRSILLYLYLALNNFGYNLQAKLVCFPSTFR